MITALRQAIARLPGVRWLLRLRAERLVAGGEVGRFWGVFDTYEAALGGASRHPSRLPAGYDRAEVAAEGRAHYEQMFLRDYPALFWIARLVDDDGRNGGGPLRLIDLGGHLGEKYRVFRERWMPRRPLEWIVLETATAAALGRALPEGDRVSGLSFTTDRAALDGAAILFASGSLQYLESDLATVLGRLAHPPAYLVLNKVPLSDGPECWTLQNAQGAVVPYHVMNRRAFVDGLARRGYRVLDTWDVPAFRVRIPLHPHLGTSANAGLCLTRDGPR
jgi:putative methyltransferase (TIGR04325 family)